MRIRAALLMTFALAACTASGKDAVPTGSPSLQRRVTPGQLVWHQLKDVPQARQDAGVAVLGTKIWMIGGLTANGATNTVAVYDTDTDSWSAGPSLPAAVSSPAVAVLGATIWVIGGFDAAHKPVAAVFKGDGKSWSRSTSSLNEPRGGAGAVAIGDVVFVAGGMGTKGPVAQIESSSALPVFVRRAPLAVPVTYPGVATDGTDLFVAGGFVASGSASKATQRYRPAANQVTRLPDMPVARGDLGLSAYKGKLVATGGEDRTDDGFPPVAAMNELDPAAGTWTQTLPPMFRPRHGACIAAIGDVLYVLGGGGQTGLAPTADAEALKAV